MLPYSFIGSWTYTNPATVVAQNIPMSDKPDWVFVKDLTNWGLASTAANPVYSEWFGTMAQDSFLGLGQTSVGAGTVNLYASQGTSNGFSFIDQTNPPTYAKVAMTAIDGTTGVMLTGTTTGVNVGDYVRLINVVSALELSSMLFQVTAVNAGVSITLGYFATAAAAGFSVANGTTGFYQKVYPAFMYPKVASVVGITQAVQAKVYFAKKNDYTVGERVDFNIPVAYGMTQLSFLTGRHKGGVISNISGAPRVLQVINSATESSIVLDYDTSGFTAFALPSSANYLGGVNGSPATCFPAGSGVVPYGATETVIGSATIPQSPPGMNLLDASDNRAQFIMRIGTSAVGVASANMQVFAFKSNGNNIVNNA
jgi:hypothetical protein